MRVLTWNVAKRKKDLSEQLQKIQSYSPDVVFLQEIYIDNGSSPWVEQLETMGYQTRDTTDLLYKMGNQGGSANLIAYESSFNDVLYETGEDLKLNSVPDVEELSFPEKIQKLVIEADHQEIELWNFHAISGSSHPLEKVRSFEAVYEGIKNSLGNNSRVWNNTEKRPVILGGDFNSPRQEFRDGQVVTFASDRRRKIHERTRKAELSLLKGLAEFKMVDAFRHINGFETMDAYSHEVGGSKFRFDHIFVSNILSPKKCFYDESGFDYSDHAPIVADLEIK
jgi:exonuclease III